MTVATFRHSKDSTIESLANQRSPGMKFASACLAFRGRQILGQPKGNGKGQFREHDSFAGKGESESVFLMMLSETESAYSPRGRA